MSTDPLADLLGPGLARQLAEIDRAQSSWRQIEALTHPLRDIEALTRPLPDPGMTESARQLMDEIGQAGSAQAEMARYARQVRDDMTTLHSTEFSAAQAAQRAAESLREIPFPSPIAELQERCRAVADQLPDTVEFMSRMGLERVFDSIDQSSRRLAEAMNPPKFVTQLAEQLNQSSAWDDVDSLSTEAGRLSAKLQRSLAESIIRQPSWRELIERLDAHAQSDGYVDHDDAPTLEALRADVESVCRETLPERSDTSQPREWTGPVKVMVTLMLLSLLIQLYPHLSEALSSPSAAEPESLTQSSRWVVQSESTVALRSSPRQNARVIMHPATGAVLTERRRTGNWIKVDAWTCRNESASGWIHSLDLETLGDGDGDLCPAAGRSDEADLPEIPTLIVQAGPAATEAWQDFFVTQHPNRHTRSTYQRACTRFMDWCDPQGLVLTAIRPTHVALWRDHLLESHAPATVKQHHSALNRLFDWLQLRQIVATNPVQPVRPPRLSRRHNQTPALTPAEVIRLFTSIGTENLTDQRDRAALALMTFNLARVSAVAQLTVGDIDLHRQDPAIRLREKRGQELRLPLNPAVVEWLDRYMTVADIRDQPRSPLFRSMGRGGGQSGVTERGLSRQDLHAMTRRRFARAGIRTKRICHTLRATGITMLLRHNVPIEIVARLAGHASIATTQQYDRRETSDLQDALARLTNSS